MLEGCLFAGIIFFLYVNGFYLCVYAKICFYLICFLTIT